MPETWDLERDVLAALDAYVVGDLVGVAAVLDNTDMPQFTARLLDLIVTLICDVDSFSEDHDAETMQALVRRFTGSLRAVMDDDPGRVRYPGDVDA